MISLLLSRCTCPICLAVKAAEVALAREQQAEWTIQHEIDRVLLVAQTTQEFGNHLQLRAHLESLGQRKDACWPGIRRAKILLAQAQERVMERHEPEKWRWITGGRARRFEDVEREEERDEDRQARRQGLWI